MAGFRCGLGPTGYPPSPPVAAAGAGSVNQRPENIIQPQLGDQRRQMQQFVRPRFEAELEPELQLKGEQRRDGHASSPNGSLAGFHTNSASAEIRHHPSIAGAPVASDNQWAMNLVPSQPRNVYAGTRKFVPPRIETKLMPELQLMGKQRRIGYVANPTGF